MNVELIRVTSAAELAHARDLRRAVFEHELGYDYGALDDRLDDYSLVLLARSGGQPVATARLTARRDGPLEDEGELWLERWTRCGAISTDEIVGCSRLVVRPEHRGQGVVAKIAARLYAHAERGGAKLVFLDASEGLLRYYMALGFRVFRRPYPHPQLRQAYWPLVLLIGDRDHFARIGSPLAKLVVEDRAQGARAVLMREFGQLAAGGVQAGAARAEAV